VILKNRRSKKRRRKRKKTSVNLYIINDRILLLFFFSLDHHLKIINAMREKRQTGIKKRNVLIEK
jgi:hypothetical protein